MCLRNLFYPCLFAEIKSFIFTVGGVAVVAVNILYIMVLSLLFLVRFHLDGEVLSWVFGRFVGTSKIKTRVRQMRHRHISSTICTITYIIINNGWLFSLFRLFFAFFHSCILFLPLSPSHTTYIWFLLSTHTY